MWFCARLHHTARMFQNVEVCMYYLRRSSVPKCTGTQLCYVLHVVDGRITEMSNVGVGVECEWRRICNWLSCPTGQFRLQQHTIDAHVRTGPSAPTLARRMGLCHSAASVPHNGWLLWGTTGLSIASRCVIVILCCLPTAMFTSIQRLTFL